MGLLLQPQTRVPKMPVNPLDVSTIVSLFPKDITQKNNTVFPGIWNIPKAKYGEFTVTPIGPSSWWKELDESQPYLEIVVGSVQVAESIIRDWAVGLPDCDMTTRMPGVFYVPGEYDETSVKKYINPLTQETFAQLRAKYEARQNNWFRKLVETADIMWARTNGNPLSVSNDARMAAELLKLDKPWLKDVKILEMKNCPACGNMVNPMFPMCSNCKYILDKAKAKELGIA